MKRCSPIELHPLTMHATTAKPIDLGRLGSIIQVVPFAEGGVRDYAQLLHSRWCRLQVSSRFVTLSRQDALACSLVERVAELRSEHEAPAALLIHFSGYGYDPRGLSGWLADEVEQVRHRLGRSLRVVVMFHELFASGPPWRSAFWLQGAQVKVAWRLARLGDHLLTNTTRHAAWLARQAAPSVEIETWPVFSNVGELVQPCSFDARRRQLMIFGSASTRQRALRNLHRHAAHIHELGVEELVEVGPGHQAARPLAGIPVRFLGRLDLASLRAVLEESRYGLIAYSEDTMGKSGVYAAYAAHGCVTLNAHPSTGPADGLISNQHFVTLDARDRVARHSSKLQQVADAAGAWYDSHRLSVQAGSFAKACGIETPRADRQD